MGEQDEPLSKASQAVDVICSKHSNACPSAQLFRSALIPLLQKKANNERISDADCNRSRLADTAGRLLEKTLNTKDPSVADAVVQLISSTPPECYVNILSNAGTDLLLLFAKFYNEISEVSSTFASAVKALGIAGAELAGTLLDAHPDTRDVLILGHVSGLLNSKNVDTLRRELETFKGTKLGTALLNAVEVEVLTRLLRSPYLFNKYKDSYKLGGLKPGALKSGELLNKLYSLNLQKVDGKVFEVSHDTKVDEVNHVLESLSNLKREVSDSNGEDAGDASTPPTFAWTAKQFEDVAKLDSAFADSYIDFVSYHNACADILGSMLKAQSADLATAVSLAGTFRCSCDSTMKKATELAKGYGAGYDTSPLRDFCGRLSSAYCKVAGDLLKYKLLGAYHLLKCGVSDANRSQLEGLLGAQLSQVESALGNLGMSDLQNICTNTTAQTYANKLLAELLKKKGADRLCTADTKFKQLAENYLVGIAKNSPTTLSEFNADAVLACDGVEVQMHSLPFTRALIFRILHDLQKPFGFFE